eukprot:TRINITY_DN6057_c0_g1_i2.p1 TRINITY_DN6057_c0_g1~~TRINITY_DN6057_c0_g1_i2.p1  ORF type:complete len:519 (+),score=91.28 TRINITY_DN6057_c0_g1_i2:1504-3060(+)
MRLNEIYGSNTQNDSQEAISLILDSLHETLRKKTSSCFSEDIRDQWESYIRTNKSIVSDLFHGMYKSSLTCPHCKNASHTFEPFSTIDLPVPGHKRSIAAFYVPYGACKRPLRIAVGVEDPDSVADFKSKAAEVLNVSADDFLISVSNNSVKQLINEKNSMRKLCEMIEDEYQLVLYQINPKLKRVAEQSLVCDPASADSGTGLEENVVTVPLLSEIYNAVSRGCTTTRLLLLNKEMSAADVYEEVFAYMREHTEKTTSVKSGENWSEKYFKLRIINNGKGVCPFCARFSCANCELPHSKSVTLKSLLAKVRASNNSLFEPTVKRERIFELELLWDESIREKVLTVLSDYTNHRSVKDSLATNTGALSLYDCIDHFAKEDTLDPHNKWLCDICKKHVQAKKSIAIHKAPRVLIIALKRFASTLNELVEFPVRGLDLGKYMEMSDGHKAVYELYAVSNHYGSIEAGHYTTVARNAKTGTWYCLDDEKVCRAESIVTPNAYVLFYRRQDVDSPNGDKKIV